jgi:hypothetical protein
MNKKTYYVSVGSGDIVQMDHVSDFEFEIQASEDELNELEELFEAKEEADTDSAVRAVTPYKEYHLDEENDRYDANLKDIYAMLYKLGSSNTRSHIESMNIL